MTTLYNCHHDGDEWRITKFVDGNPESSYLTTHAECQCPAGARPTCRHRQMLPWFIEQDLVNSPWFLDFRSSTDLRVCDFEGNGVSVAMREFPPVPEGLHSEPLPLPGMTQQNRTTYNYMDDGSVQIIEHQPTTPTPAPFRRRI